MHTKVNIKVQFYDWLINKLGLSKNSAIKYSHQSINYIDKFLIKKNFTFTNLYDLSLSEVKEIKNFLDLDKDWLHENKVGQRLYSTALKHLITFLQLYFKRTHLPKPFLLLAGISGTGKSRFVKEQARLSDSNLNNFCMLSVRPDWHEPSD